MLYLLAHGRAQANQKGRLARSRRTAGGGGRCCGTNKAWPENGPKKGGLRYLPRADHLSTSPFLAPP
jgi:hypothetical protein